MSGDPIEDVVRGLTAALVGYVKEVYGFPPRGDEMHEFLEEVLDVLDDRFEGRVD